MAIYMKYPSIDGESTTKGFEKQIELTSFQFGVMRPVSSARGTSTRESSEASVSDISVTKATDATSLKLLEQSLHGKLDNQVVITFTRTLSGGGVQAYLEYTLTGCGVSAFSLSSGGERPSESLSLNFDKFEFKYGKIGDELSSSSSSTSYNLATATKT